MGLGVTHDLAPGASVFADYDGKLTGGFDQHAFSAGIKVRF